MGKLIYVEAGEVATVHGIKVKCNTHAPFHYERYCWECVFFGTYCDDIACTPIERDDADFVYFKRIE